MRVRYGSHVRPTAHTACEVCTKVAARPFVDHCHTHGWVRGTVCPSCNRRMAGIDKRLLPTTLVSELLSHAAKCPDCPAISENDLAKPVKSETMHRTTPTTDQQLYALQAAVADRLGKKITQVRMNSLLAALAVVGQRYPAEIHAALAA